MATELTAVRNQILANAKIMLKPDVSLQNEKNGSADTNNGNGNTSQATLLGPHNHHDLDVVIFGHPEKYTAAVMWGLTPAIQGAVAASPEAAVRRLLLATAELLNNYIPKIGTHQRNIHGGGIFNEDLISTEIVEAQRMC